MNPRALAPILVLALAAAGCGVSGDDEADNTVPATPAEAAGSGDGVAPTGTTPTATDEAAATDGDPQPIAGDAEAETYFLAVEASAQTLGVAVERLFSTPLGLETEAIAERLYSPDGTPTGEVTADEEATLREFFTTFWTDAAGHTAALGDDLRALDPPDAVRAEHDAYVAAVDAIVDSTDQRVAEIQARDVADLPDILWEPDDKLAAMEAASAALDAEAARLGIDAEACPQ